MFLFTKILRKNKPDESIYKHVNDQEYYDILFNELLMSKAHGTIYFNDIYEKEMHNMTCSNCILDGRIGYYCSKDFEFIMPVIKIIPKQLLSLPISTAKDFVTFLLNNQVEEHLFEIEFNSKKYLVFKNKIL